MQDMPLEEARSVLSSSRMGILCLDHDGSGYGVPLFYGRDGDDLYFHCHPGMKDHFIDSTSEACLVVVHMESENVWESVQVFGPVEKLSLSDDLDRAKNALYNVPFPPAEGNYPSGKPVRSDQSVYYMRLRPSRVAGKMSAYKED